MTELKNKKRARAERIKRRCQMYIDGKFSLNDFYQLERLDVVNDTIEIGTKETADELRDLYEHEKQKAPAPDPCADALDNMTREEFNQLPLMEQNEYYNMAPEKVRKILAKRPAYLDIIDPQKKAKEYRDTTPAEFKTMTLAELSDLYNADPATYNRLQAEKDQTGGAEHGR